MKLSKDVTKTRIICTIGPKSATKEVMAEMLENGMSIARFHLSYAAKSTQATMMSTLTTVVAENDALCASLVALRGLSFRVGHNVAPRMVAKGDIVTVDCKGSAADDEWNAGADVWSGLWVSGKELVHVVHKGSIVSFNFGRCELEVLHVDVNAAALVCRGVDDGWISPLDPVSADWSPFDSAFLQRVVERDVKDALWAVKQGAMLLEVPPMSLNPVRSALKGTNVRFLVTVGDPVSLHEALARVDAGDRVKGTVLLRSSLGTSCGPELPRLQSALVEHGVNIQCPVFVCAHMLQSMITNPRPSRSETSDVYNAVQEGAYGLMLVGETAVGHDPGAAVAQCARICREAENDIDHRAEYVALRQFVRPPIAVAASLASSAALMARDQCCEQMLLVSPSEMLSVTLAQYSQCRAIHAFPPDHEVAAAQELVLRGRTVVVTNTEQECRDVDVLVNVLRKAGVLTNDKLVVVIEETIDVRD